MESQLRVHRGKRKQMHEEHTNAHQHFDRGCMRSTPVGSNANMSRAVQVPILWVLHASACIHFSVHAFDASQCSCVSFTVWLILEVLFAHKYLFYPPTFFSARSLI